MDSHAIATHTAGTVRIIVETPRPEFEAARRCTFGRRLRWSAGAGNVAAAVEVNASDRGGYRVCWSMWDRSGPRHYSRRFLAEGDALLFGAIKASQLIGIVERAAARDAIHARRAAILGAAA